MTENVTPLECLSFVTRTSSFVTAFPAFYAARRTYDRPLPSFHRLTFRRGTVDQAFFTPDRQNVVYTARWNGGPREVFTVRADGVDSVAREGLQSFTALAISSRNELALMRTATLSTAPVASGAPRDLLRGVSGADWNPDGSQLGTTVLDAGGR